MDKYIITAIKVTGMTYLLFIVLLVAILTTAGCVSKNKETVVTSTPTPLPKDVQVPDPIIGFWRKSLSTGYYNIYQFNADGTFDSILRENLDTWDTRQGHGTWSAQGNNSYTLYDSTLGGNETFIYDPIRMESVERNIPIFCYIGFKMMRQSKIPIREYSTPQASNFIDINAKKS